MSEKAINNVAYAIGAVGFSALSLHYDSGWCTFAAVLCFLALM